VALKFTDLTIKPEFPARDPRDHPRDERVCFRVRFYSIPAQAWCEFYSQFDHSGAYNYSTHSVSIWRPRRKEINLRRRTDKEFEVGGVTCCYNKQYHWVIDGVIF